MVNILKCVTANNELIAYVKLEHKKNKPQAVVSRSSRPDRSHPHTHTARFCRPSCWPPADAHSYLSLHKQQNSYLTHFT